MAPTIDLNVIKSHTKSDIHIMALTYHVSFIFIDLVYPTDPKITKLSRQTDKATHKHTNF